MACLGRLDLDPFAVQLVCRAGERVVKAASVGESDKAEAARDVGHSIRHHLERKGVFIMEWQVLVCGERRGGHVCVWGV